MGSYLKSYKGLKFYHAIFADDKPFRLYFPDAEHVTVDRAEELEKPGVLVIWGGGDISPAIYNRDVHPRTGAGDRITGRDRIEVALARKAIEIGMPIFGVCRGAQLVCAMAGGILVQHVTGHTNSGHLITLKSGKRIPYTTLHHQMMYPWKVKHELLGWTSRLSHVYEGVSEEEAKLIEVEPEIVVFPEINSFGVQGHPEFMAPDHGSVKETMKLFKRHCLNEGRTAV